MKWIHTRSRRTRFGIHISDILVGTYSDIFELWERIPLDIQKKIFAIDMDKINLISGCNWNVPAASWWDLGMVIDDEDMLLLRYIVYISLIVYCINTIDGKLTNVFPDIKGSKIMIRIAIGKTHV